MIDRSNLPFIAGVLLLILLIFNFLDTIFKSDVKRFSNTRVYVDYTTKRPTGGGGGAPATIRRGISQPVARASLDTFHSMGEQAVALQVNAFEQFTRERLGTIAADKLHQPANDPAYQEAQRLGAVSVPDLVRAELELRQRHFDTARDLLERLLTKLPEKDVIHRMKLYELMAEVEFQQNRKEGYVQNKLKYFRAMVQWQALVKRAFPKTEARMPWLSPEDATRNLLRIKSFATSQLSGREQEQVIRRAELDLEVARLMSSG